MRKLRRITETVSRSALLAGLAFGFNACTENSALSPEKPQAIERTEAKVVQTNIGPIKLLQVDPAKQQKHLMTLRKSAEDSIHAAEQTIVATAGGVLQVGEASTGVSLATIAPNALSGDADIVFEWAVGSSYTGLLNADESAEVTLNSPVGVSLSFKWAELYGVDEDSLALYFYNSETDSLELVGGVVDKLADVVTASLDRFGQFGLYEMKDGELEALVRREPNVFFMEKYIKARAGGRVVIGNREVGLSGLRFPPKALPENLDIEFEWASGSTFEGMLNDLRFGPHGTNFNKPVKLVLSYKTADLTGVNEDDLKVFYHNEDTGIWELIGGNVNKKKKRVVCWLNHFSRYAIGGE